MRTGTGLSPSTLAPKKTSLMSWPAKGRWLLTTWREEFNQERRAVGCQSIGVLLRQSRVCRSHWLKTAYIIVSAGTHS